MHPGASPFIAIICFCPIEHPVKWLYAAKKINSQEAVLLIKATINTNWHIYSLNGGGEEGPVKTSFTFTPSSEYNLDGKIAEPMPVTHFEKAFNMNVSYFENSVVFQQKIKLKSSQAPIKGSLEYMACTNQKCLPPEEVDFSILIK